MDDIISKFKKDFSVENIHIVTSCSYEPVSNENAIPSNQSAPAYLCELFRRYKLQLSFKYTILNSIDAAEVVKLCANASTSCDVEEPQLPMNCDLITERLCNETEEDSLNCRYHEFLIRCNLVDIAGIWHAILKAVTDSREDILIELRNTAIIWICNNTSELCVLENLMNRNLPFKAVFAKHDNSFEIEKVNLVENMNLNCGICTFGITNSTQKLFLAHLELLVNSRSEPRLAQVFCIPASRGLSRKAFNTLKHSAARTPGLTLLQVAQSFIIKRSLGGKGYAPQLDNPLNRFAPGLVDLVELFNKLQTYIEDIQSPLDALEKCLTTISKVVSGDPLINSSEAEAQCRVIVSRATDLLRKSATTDKNVNATQLLIRDVLDSFATQWRSSLDFKNPKTSSTPSRTPSRTPGRSPGSKSLSELFKTPDNLTPTPRKRRKKPRPFQQQQMFAPQLHSKFQSHLDWVHPDQLQPAHISPVCTPSPVLAASSSRATTPAPEVNLVAAEQRKHKRLKQDDDENEKQTKNKPAPRRQLITDFKKSAKTKKSKKNAVTVASGQKRISDFFTRK